MYKFYFTLFNKSYKFFSTGQTQTTTNKLTSTKKLFIEQALDTLIITYTHTKTDPRLQTQQLFIIK